MDSTLLFFLILFQESVNCLIFAVEENSTSSRSAYFMTRENKRLEGHVVKRLQSGSLMLCGHLCLRNAWCTSTNFEATSSVNGKGTCELNKHGAINTDSELYEQQGVTFSMVQKVISKFIICPAPRAGKMNQILRCDWLPERARWSYLARSGLPSASGKKDFPDTLLPAYMGY